MIGFEVSEIHGESFTKFVAPEDMDLVVENYKLRQARGKLSSIFLRMANDA